MKTIKIQYKGRNENKRENMGETPIKDGNMLDACYGLYNKLGLSMYNAFETAIRSDVSEGKTKGHYIIGGNSIYWSI